MTPRPSNENRRTTGLSAEAVADAALALVDAEGLDALSMRRLAEQLGVGTMTLYGHFRNKDELLAAVVDRGFADFEDPGPGGPWRERLTRHAEASRATLLRHPALVQLRGRHTITRRQAFRVSEGAVAALLDAGFAPDEAAQAFRLVFNYVFASVLYTPRAPSAAEARAARAALLTLPPEEFPALTSTADAMVGALGGDDVFAYGLARILDGLEARLAR